MHNFSLFPLFLLEAAKNDKKDNKVETFSSELRWLGRWPTLKPEQDVEMFFFCNFGLNGNLARIKVQEPSELLVSFSKALLTFPKFLVSTSRPRI